MNRRSFLKSTLGLSLTSVSAPDLLAAAASEFALPATPLRLGFIGLGDMGTQNLNAFLAKDGVHIAALCDVDRIYLQSALQKVHRKQSAGNCSTFTDYRKLLTDEELNAVVVSVPDHWHGVIECAAARAGLDIYGEKPLAYNIAEGRAICNEITRNARVFQTGSWQRSQSHFHHACELVRNHRLGNVHKVEVGLGDGFRDHFNRIRMTDPVPPPPELDYDMWLGPAPHEPYCRARLHKNWRWNLDYGGGKLTDWIGHHGDIALWGLGLEHTGPEEVEATGEFGEGFWNVPIRFRSECRFPGGPTIVLGSDFPEGTRWIGERGELFVSRAGIRSLPVEIGQAVIEPGEIRLYKSRDHAQNFLDCIRTRRKTVAPAESAHRAASLAHLSLISLLVGRKLRWDAAAERFINDPDADRLLSRPMRSPWQL